MKALYWIVIENIALRKWHSLNDLLDRVGVDLKALELGTQLTIVIQS